MPARTSHVARLAPSVTPDHLRRLRVELGGGARTTLYVATYDLERWCVRLALLRRQRPLALWCAEQGYDEALVGGFYTRPTGLPLGEVRTRGVLRRHEPFTPPFGATRACLHVDGTRLRVAGRDELAPAPRGDLLQAGPMLVRDGDRVIRHGVDPEGFSAGQAQFDSDITRGRYPRSAFGLTEDGRALSVVCDGRGRWDAGMTLSELADVLVGLGARDALNLDGGGSATLIAGGELRNRPREEHGVELAGGRAVTTALVFEPRA